VRLRLDHLIFRTADAGATLAELARRSGAPVLADAEELVGAMASGIARAGSVDLDVLRIGGTPPAQVLGYGLGFVADVPLMEAVGELRALGVPVSAPAPAEAGEGAEKRPWRAAQVHGLLPKPFPAPVNTRKPGLRDRLTGAAAGTLGRIGPLARAGTNDPGESMVVLTEYGFDVDTWRASATDGPAVAGVEIGTAGARDAWERLPLAGDVPLTLDDDGPAGIRRVLLSGRRRRPFALGSVRFEWV
jgi:hypothetical protein